MMKHYATLCIFTPILLSFNAISTSGSNSNKTVLVFGGSGQVSTDVVLHLLQHNYKPILVSRGHWEFDTYTLIQPNVTHFTCDRAHKPVNFPGGENYLAGCFELMDFIHKQNHIDFVIDFSSVYPEQLKHAVDFLKGKVGLYIFTSSHSIYGISRKPQMLPVKEAESVRPDDKKERKRLIKQNRMADGKKQSEEYLMRRREKGGFPYMILRLPDVIGPRDTSFEKWWLLQFWIKYYHSMEIPIVTDSQRSRRDQKFSLVYTKDIAKAILSAMEAGDKVHDQVYNIGFDEAIEYKDIVKSIAKELNTEGIEFKRGKGAFQIYPSTTRGPLDMQKIKEQLGFVATPLEHAIKETVAWYDRAFIEHDDHLYPVIQTFISNIGPKVNENALFDAIHKHFGIKDEL